MDILDNLFPALNEGMQNNFDASEKARQKIRSFEVEFRLGRQLSMPINIIQRVRTNEWKPRAGGNQPALTVL